MALPPSIPTSFVPKQPVTTTARKRTSGSNPFLALSYIIVGVAVLGCFGVFGYQYYLQSVAQTKANDVVVAQNKIDQSTVTEFIRLRDRFTAGKELLNTHVALSQFFDSLEGLTLQGVRFSSLKVTVSDDRTATVDMAGSARSFNTLAAQSSAFAADKRFKRAIFSGITLNSKDNSVNFALSADLDPSLVIQSASAAATVPAASNPVPATTTPKATTQKTGTTTP